MQEGVAPVFSSLCRKRRRATYSLKSGLRLPRLCLEFRSEALAEGQESFDALRDGPTYSLTHLGHAGPAVAKPSSRPEAVHLTHHEKMSEPMFLAELEKRFGGAQDRGGISADGIRHRKN